MIGVLSACGYNTKAVNDFNESAVGLTKGFSAITDKSIEWCYESMLSSQLGNSKYESQEKMKATIDSTCKAFAKDVKTSEASAVVVNTYAAALSALVGISPQFIEDDAKNLKDAVLTIKNADGKQKLTSNEVVAFEKMTNLLSEMMTTAAIKDKATQLMRDNSAAVNRQVDIMLAVARQLSDNASWIASTTNTALISNLDQIGSLKNNGGKATNEQAIPYRYLAYLLAKQHPNEQDVTAAITKFEAAGESFKKANTDLENKFSKLSKEDQLKSINELKDKIDALRESIQAMRNPKEEKVSALIFKVDSASKFSKKS
jgi:outer membrane murein-binding lipoprotein Lpp